MMALVSESRGRLVADELVERKRRFSCVGEEGALAVMARGRGGRRRGGESRMGDWTDEAETKVSSDEALAGRAGVRIGLTLVMGVFVWP